jgi:excinuclease ABC subunit A
LRYTRAEIIELLLKEYSAGTKLQLIAPMQLRNEIGEEAIQRLQQMGYIRLRINGKEWTNEESIPPMNEKTLVEVVVDRIEMKEGVRERLATSIDTAMDLSRGILKVEEGKSDSFRYLTEVYVCPETGYRFPPLQPADFNFNSIHGACPHCKGEGKGCPVCHGDRLKPESLACLVHGKNIAQLCNFSAAELLQTIDSWHFSGKEKIIADELLPPIRQRLLLLKQVGLDYLELNRPGNTLSDGEAQRIQLASHIGAKLSGLIYVLDEPSLGLHRQDIHYLQTIMKELKEIGNTVVIVEHEPGLIRCADLVIELGPGAGNEGGNITFQGTYEEMLQDPVSITGKWLSGRKKFPKPSHRKKMENFLQVKNVSLHNLKNFSVKIPLGCLVGICGVSGSGKSTLAIDIIGEPIQKYLSDKMPVSYVSGYESIQRIVLGLKLSERFSARSIPATYVDIMTPLRKHFAETKMAKARGYTASRFSLNKRGGRCDACDGLGEIRVNMQLMPDLFIPCEVCQGSRYNYETLQVTWENRSIADILEMTVDEAQAFFRFIPSLVNPLTLMQELGLGYLTLGQSSKTLSGGEIQRLRLVSDLVTKHVEKTLYILDEPSSGLHLEDCEKLLRILQRLVDQGHSVVMIEHNIELLKQADRLIELGPGAGKEGGKVIFEGTAAQLAKAATPTGRVIFGE